MNDKPNSKKSKPKNVLMAMFEKKFKAMETLPKETHQCNVDSSAPSLQNILHSEGAAMKSDNSNADNVPSSAENGQFDQSDQPAKTEYEMCMLISVRCMRYLLRQGLACRVQDQVVCWDSDDEGVPGNEWISGAEAIFIDTFKLIATFTDGFEKAVLENALEYHQLTKLEVQNTLIRACAKETTKLIIQDLAADYFGIIVDGNHDKFHEYHLSLYLRYVDKRGMVIERFLGIVHVDDLTPVTCKAVIDSLLLEYTLSPSKIRGQSYNGGSSLAGCLNGDINGINTLVRNESQCAYHLHCFSHQLHATLVNVAGSCEDCIWVFLRLADLVSLVRDSCSRTEMLQETKAQNVLEALGSCELENRKYVIEEYGLQKPYDNWEYDHFKTLVHVLTLFPTIVEVLDLVAEKSIVEYRVKADKLLDSLLSFKFVVVAHLIMPILGCTDSLNLAVQRMDRDIANVISLVSVAKNQLQRMRSNHEWDEFLNKVSSFCARNDIEVPDMNADYEPAFARLRCVKPSTNLHHFRDEVYFSVIDRQLQELNNLFDETNMELLSCMACLNPSDSFSSFDKQKLIRLAEFYPGEFSAVELTSLEFQLDIFIADMRSDDRFRNLKDLGELSAKLVETEKHDLHSNVYLLLKLMLILPVATPSIERTVSAMDHVKYKLLNNVGNQRFYDSLIADVESEIFSRVLDDDILSSFKAMKTSQGI